jgi:hypothetical protein
MYFRFNLLVYRFAKIFVEKTNSQMIKKSQWCNIFKNEGAISYFLIYYHLTQYHVQFSPTILMSNHFQTPSVIDLLFKIDKHKLIMVCIIHSDGTIFALCTGCQ